MPELGDEFLEEAVEVQGLRCNAGSALDNDGNAQSYIMVEFALTAPESGVRDGEIVRFALQPALAKTLAARITQACATLEEDS